MREIDCKKCNKLIDTERGCSVYGSDADAAVKKCADDKFANYTIGMRLLAKRREEGNRKKHEFRQMRKKAILGTRK